MRLQLNSWKFTLFVSPKSAEKSPVISTDHYAPSSVPHSGFGTLDLVNVDAASVLPLMPTYPIKVVCESRPLSAQHPSRIQRDKMTKLIERDREMDIRNHNCVTTLNAHINFILKVNEIWDKNRYAFKWIKSFDFLKYFIIVLIHLIYFPWLLLIIMYER